MFSIWKPTIMKTYTEEGKLIRHYEGDELPTPPYITSISLDTGNRVSIHPSAEDAFNCLLRLLKSDDRIDVRIFTHKLPYRWKEYSGLSLHSFKTLAVDHFPNHLSAVVSGDLPERRYEIRLQFHYLNGVRLFKLSFIRDSYSVARHLYKEVLIRFDDWEKAILGNIMVNHIGKLAVYLKAHLKLLDIPHRANFSKQDIDKISRLYQQIKTIPHRPFKMVVTPKAGYGDPITFIRMFHEQYGYPVICPYTCGVKFVK